MSEEDERMRTDAARRTENLVEECRGINKSKSYL